MNLNKQHHQFQKGDILKMDVASRSHVKDPYYVEVLYSNTTAERGEITLIVGIPGYNYFAMPVAEWAFEYHLPRMTKVGTTLTHRELLYNQDSLKDHNKVQDDPDRWYANFNLEKVLERGW